MVEALPLEQASALETAEASRSEQASASETAEVLASAQGSASALGAGLESGKEWPSDQVSASVALLVCSSEQRSA